MGQIPSQKEMEQAFTIRHGEERQKRFQESTVAVCGLGGLGSNIAIALARAGIGKLILIDFDQVDVTNLHRQQYKASQVGEYKTLALKENLLEIAPYLQIETYNEKIEEDNIVPLLGKAQIICEAFDQAESKAVLVNGVMENLPETYMIAASGMSGFGSANSIRTRKITERFYLCGDGVSEVSEEDGLVASRVMICAAHQAHMVLRLLSGEQEV